MPISWDHIIARGLAAAFLLLGASFSTLGPVLFLFLLPDVIPYRVWSVGFFLLEAPSYFYFLSLEQPYSIEDVENTEIQGLNHEEAEQLLKSKRSRFSWFLLRTISRKPGLSEADLGKEARKSRFQYSDEGAGNVLDDLVRIGLVSAGSNPRRKQHQLTERGKSCLTLINTHFPRTRASYLIKTALGRSPR